MKPRISYSSRFALAALLLAAACAPQPATIPAAPARPTAPAPPPPGSPIKTIRAIDLPVTVVPFTAAPAAATALPAFRKSCASLKKREDRTGLTSPGDWDAACAAAATATDPARFFTDNFRAVAIGAEPGKGFSTGYYEPEIAGSRTAQPGYTPFYRRPPDLVEVDLGDFAKDLKGRKLRGRVDGRALVPYHTRADVMAGALADKSLELAWAADPYEAFFLEIQGSGRLKLPGGKIMRIGYDTQNGRDYVAIGKVLLDRGDLQKGGVSMDSILAWLRANPAKAPALLAANPSVVFFREVIGDGPIGAMGIAVTPQVSVAADTLFIPLGAPLLVTTTLPGNIPLAAIMVAQDTGGAIKGANRIDLFRGAGAAARAEAGAQSAEARVLVLIPVAAAARLGQTGR
ncbi:murein transglycosylase [Polymorphobacter glacialis]|uniref:peptidoglycan lytic exotransglycosylase n=1 Tax=Sandarakinorhabdus glacialis TaxID=1614636 RepID=A0A916ZV55_9SPHN|nr:murein transglycosylase A [Polymorphobacter glacialis]GGE13023.1 murein transglycosylase [Polymorphobacter glacialis]